MPKARSGSVIEVGFDAISKALAPAATAGGQRRLKTTLKTTPGLTADAPIVVGWVGLDTEDVNLLLYEITLVGEGTFRDMLPVFVDAWNAMIDLDGANPKADTIESVVPGPVPAGAAAPKPQITFEVTWAATLNARTKL